MQRSANDNLIAVSWNQPTPQLTRHFVPIVPNVNTVGGNGNIIADDVIAKRLARHELSVTKLAPVTD
jgi:hypothetical protein